MTQKRRSPVQAHKTKVLLGQLMIDMLADTQLITHEALAMAHVLRNKSRSADDDVAHYGGPAVVDLRREKGYALAPVTASFHRLTLDSLDSAYADAVAGAGAGGPRIGWYLPSDEDDPIWKTYLGMRLDAAAAAIFWVAAHARDSESKGLLSPGGSQEIAARAAMSVQPPQLRLEEQYSQQRSQTPK